MPMHAAAVPAQLQEEMAELSMSEEFWSKMEVVWHFLWQCYGMCM